MRKRALPLGFVAATTLLATSIPAHAETLTQFFQKSHIDGQIRSYYFSRLYGTPNTPNASAYSLAGRLNVITAPFLTGFRVGVSFYTANSLGTQSSDPARIDKTLMGIGSSINTLGQAYLQYSQPWLTVRVGDQLINTPWLNRVGGRVIPVTYQGVYAKVSPIAHLNLVGLRVFRWKGRTSNNFYRDNLYYPTNYNGDALYAGPNNLPSTIPAANGALAFGVKYALDGATVQSWYYDFYHFAKMCYGAGQYMLHTRTGFNPFVAAQFVREWESNNAFAQTGTQLFNQPGETVNSTAYGVKAGLKFPKGSVFWAYDATNLHPGAVGGGAIVSPYTIGYTADPLYVDAMIQGLVGVGPGHGWRLRAAYWLWHRRIHLATGFSQFNTYFTGNSNWTHVSVTYFPKGFLQGLAVRDQFEVANGGVNLYPGSGKNAFVYNRVMLTYKF
ncbi:OprD family porin [Acidithiobacillus ferrivorans]|uniref:Porin n=1 Tax=Acidithiobacillus ferrivorans TaxID=160808 RepID=A0A7T4WEA9_9PROT|nr:hypothetical protein [Acidithiobacillus ferrivorans]QQD73032.1 hypothetical protein H2515_01455 [Acidithiobacillus ferrivorans]